MDHKETEVIGALSPEEKASLEAKAESFKAELQTLIKAYGITDYVFSSCSAGDDRVKAKMIIAISHASSAVNYGMLTLNVNVLQNQTLDKLIHRMRLQNTTDTIFDFLEKIGMVKKPGEPKEQEAQDRTPERPTSEPPLAPFSGKMKALLEKLLKPLEDATDSDLVELRNVCHDLSNASRKRGNLIDLPEPFKYWLFNDWYDRLIDVDSEIRRRAYRTSPMADES